MQPALAGGDEEDITHPPPEKVQVGNSPIFSIEQQLGKGGFGTVYKGRRLRRSPANAQKPYEVAVKLEHRTSKGCTNGQPPHEWSVYQQIGDVYGVPKLWHKGRSGDFYVMIMDLLGTSLFDQHNVNHLQFDAHYTACVAVEALTILRGLHEKGWVHGDVKPENFLLGPENTPKHNRLFLVDLGLASKWRQSNGLHVRYEQKPEDFRGTVRYASVHQHLGRQASRRDDLEMLAYSLVYLLVGRLPWQGTQGDNRTHQVGSKKAVTNAQVLCSKVHPPTARSIFQRFIEAVLSLRFDEPPRYEALMALFEPLILQGTTKALLVNSAAKAGSKRGRDEVDALKYDDDGQPRKRVRTGYPASQWITVYNQNPSMKQRYHYNVGSNRLDLHVKKGMQDGLYISSVGCQGELWAIVMDAGTGYTEQVYRVAQGAFLPKDWIVQQWDASMYISAVAGSASGQALVVMSKGMRFTQQSYKVSDSFPFEWIKKKWKERFAITSMATSGRQWAVVMSRCPDFHEQVVELDYMYSSEGIHRRWDEGYRITACAATGEQAACVLSMPRTVRPDETQETLRTSAFPSTHIKEKWGKDLYISCMAYGRTVL